MGFLFSMPPLSPRSRVNLARHGILRPSRCSTMVTDFTRSLPSRRCHLRLFQAIGLLCKAVVLLSKCTCSHSRRRSGLCIPRKLFRLTGELTCSIPLQRLLALARRLFGPETGKPIIAGTLLCDLVYSCIWSHSYLDVDQSRTLFQAKL